MAVKGFAAELKRRQAVGSEEEHQTKLSDATPG